MTGLADDAVKYQRMLMASLGFYAQEKIRGHKDYGRKFLIGRHHLEWSEHAAIHKRIRILAPRDHGKCVSPETLVLAASGARVRAAAWVGGEILAYDERSHALVPAYAPPAVSNGVKPCLRIKTRTGREEIVTTNHPLRKLFEWSRADQLRIGDRIAVPRELVVEGATPVDEPWFLGVLVGNGCLTGSSVAVSNADAAVGVALGEVADRRGWRLTPPSDDRPCAWDFAHTSGQARELWPLELTRWYGLHGKDAFEKRVPDAVFEAPRVDVAEFIAGLGDTDCHVNVHGGGSVEFFSVSKLLMQDVLHLLCRLGVVAVLAEKNGRYNGAPHKSWRLTIRGRSICRLADWIGSRLQGKRATELRELAAEQSIKDEGGSVDLLPVEVYSLVQHSEDWFRKRGLPRYSKSYALTRSKARELADAEGNTELRAIADAEILWDEVVEIEDVGARETWAITVPGLENFVANDIVNHNSFFWSLAYPLWMVEKHPGDEECGYIFSATQRGAEKLLRIIKREVENNPKLKHLLPDDRSDQWSASCLRFANGHIIYAHGSGTAVRGGHPRWVVCDDILGDRVATSPAVRAGVTDYVLSTIEPMLIPKSQWIVVGTPLAEDDVYAELAKAEREFTCFAYPAVDKDWTVALWPERYPIAALRKKLKFHGSLKFTREYLCVARSNLSSLFPDELFDKPGVYRFDVSLGWSKKKLEQELGITVFYQGTDYGLTATDSSDSTVNWIWGFDKQGCPWIVEVDEVIGVGYDEQRIRSERLGMKYDVALAYSEANQAQRMFGVNMQQETEVPVELFNTGASKHTLEKGIPCLRVPLETGRMRLPVGDERSKEIVAKWRSQMQGFVFERGQVVSTTAHDDLAMGSWIGWRAAKDGKGFEFSFEPEDGDGELAADELALMGFDTAGQPLKLAVGPAPGDTSTVTTDEYGDESHEPSAPTTTLPLDADARYAEHAARAAAVRDAVPGGSWLSVVGFG